MHNYPIKHIMNSYILKTVFGFIGLFLAICFSNMSSSCAANITPKDLVWNSPSQDYHGSMPLGNGDIGLNVWFGPDHDLQFFISKTDAWDDNGRLVKIGKVRVRFEPAFSKDKVKFQQTLNLRKGTIQIELSEADRKLSLSVWVDANHPVIHVLNESSKPVTSTASIELWRTQPFEVTELQTSDVLLHQKNPDGTPPKFLIEPDTFLENQTGRIGWFHYNKKSVGPDILAQIQGLKDFKQTDPLLHRTFGALVLTKNGKQLSHSQLQSTTSTANQFSIYVLTEHPSSPEKWLSQMDTLVKNVESQPFAKRRESHIAWWHNFWNRSWIHASSRSVPGTQRSYVPGNTHPIRIGEDQQRGNQFKGQFGRITIFNQPLSESHIQQLAKGNFTDKLSVSAKPVYVAASQGSIPNSSSAGFASGMTLEGWVNPAALPTSGARLIDKITSGQSDGFLLDTHPGNSLRFICGRKIVQQTNVLPPDQWSHVAAVVDPVQGFLALYLNGKCLAKESIAATANEAETVSQMYNLQRFINACAGRGAFPIKFNGSIFTVPPYDGKGDPDYRRWGPGYWWQNTRLPYISMCASGDYDLMKPLFRMYADQLLELCKYRTRLYCGHDGAFYPECIYFWGPIFSETYGWTPFEKRTDKLQESGWHKWEWVGGLELCWMMLDYYEHTEDNTFFKQTVLPFTHEILTFFDQHYPTNSQGKLVMHPSQALETWWNCTNAMPEVAGCIAVTDRMLTVPSNLLPPSTRDFLLRFKAKIPSLPLREINGQKALAPAETFKQKQNIENPELYATFPFRLFAVGRPNPEYAITALEHRWDRGSSGWRQDDVFMAYLGLTNQVRGYLVERALTHDANSRFPAFWGPNYDWIPDQDHGGILLKAFQSMLLQTDGRKIYLFPAWPSDWDVEFKLRAPFNTLIECTYQKGAIKSLRITPPERKRDIVVSPVVQ